MDKNLRHLESRLRAERPRPSAELMRALTPRRRTNARRQFAFATGLTAIMLIALASVGGVSYAANAVQHAAKVAAKAVTPKAHHATRTVFAISSGGDQYKPGYGFGDPNHNHAGPPGLTKGKPGEKTPPAQTRKIGKATVVTTSITVDEQAALYFSVLDSSGNELLLTQKGSKFGTGGAQGKQTKSIHYVMLVPRTLPFSIRIPSSLLVAGHTYSVRVIAVDSDGNKSTTTIAFTA
jgi:hypothetical protein